MLHPGWEGTGPRERRRRAWGDFGPVRLLVGAVVVVVVAGGSAVGQLSGKFGLDLVARRIPTTVTDEIKLDAPSEFALLEFGLTSALDVRLDLGLARLLVDTATNMAGPEHLVVAGTAVWEDLSALGVTLDEVSLSPEIWFAVPFEAVTDVNNLPNSVVIPPGDPLFVALRLTGSASWDGWKIQELLMFQDVNFPSPSSGFAPLLYPCQSQSFAWGSLTSLSWSAPQMTSFGAVLGLGASSSGTSVKGYSAGGSVDPGNLFLSLSASSVFIGTIGYGPFALRDVSISASTTLTPTQTPSISIGLSGSLSEDATVSTSLTLYGLQPLLGSITMSVSYGPFRAAFDLECLALKSLALNCSTPLTLGGMKGSFGLSATGLEQGLTGLGFHLNASEGLFSAGTSMTLARLGGKLGFASLGTQLAFRLSPGVISAQATFGKYGLTRAALSTGVTF